MRKNGGANYVIESISADEVLLRPPSDESTQQSAHISVNHMDMLEHYQLVTPKEHVLWNNVVT